MLDNRSGSDRRSFVGRRSGPDRRVAVVPVAVDRRSGLDRRSRLDRRLYLDRRQAAFSLSQIL